MILDSLYFMQSGIVRILHTFGASVNWINLHSCRLFWSKFFCFNRLWGPFIHVIFVYCLTWILDIYLPTFSFLPTYFSHSKYCTVIRLNYPRHKCSTYLFIFLIYGVCFMYEWFLLSVQSQNCMYICRKIPNSVFSLYILHLLLLPNSLNIKYLCCVLLYS